MIDPRTIVRLVGAGASLLCFAVAAQAFSEIDPGEGGGRSAREGIIAVPLPPLGDVPPEPVPESEPETPPGGEAEDEATIDPPAEPADPVVPPPTDPLEPGGVAAPGETPAEAGPATVEPVRYGEDGLPQPVRDLRRRLIAIAKAGEIEALRPYIQTGAEPTLVSFGDTPDDPIAYMRQVSGDGGGAELLAILLEILESGYAHVEAGTDEEIYVWPYFAQADLDRLTPAQKVELFELVTAGDFEAMRSFGAYNFYRAGISPEGRLEFFVAGD